MRKKVEIIEVKDGSGTDCLGGDLDTYEYAQLFKYGRNKNVQAGTYDVHPEGNPKREKHSVFVLYRSKRALPAKQVIAAVNEVLKEEYGDGDEEDDA